MRFRGLDLNLLVALDTVLQEMNVTRAAQRLNMTQSTLSGILGRLRTHFKDPLFVMHGKALHQTPLAMQLRAPLRDAVLQLEAIISTDGQFDPRSSRRHFKVEFPDRLVPVLLPRIAARLLPYAPTITVEFHQPKGPPAPLLYHGQLDLVVTPDVYKVDEFPSIELIKDSMVVVGWVGNEAMREPITADGLKRMPMVKMDFVAQRLTHLMSEEQLGLIVGGENIAMVAPTFGAIPEMLIGSNAIAILHRHLATASARHLPLVIQPLPFPSPALSDVIMLHPTRANDHGLQWLIGQFLDAASEFRSEGAVESPSQ